MSKETMNTQPTTSIEEDEIDLLALAKTLWNGRKTVIKITFIFMILGFFIAIFSAKEYTATSTMVPQFGDSKKLGGNLGGLAAMAGINLGSIGGDTGIPPTLYPQIVNSIPFQKELLQTPLTIKGLKKQITYEKYYQDVYSPGIIGTILKYTLGLPGVIIKAIKGKPDAEVSNGKADNLLRISDDEKELIEQLSEQLSLDVNVKDGYVTLYANMPEPQAAAELALKAQELLQRYIIDFKIQKSQNQLQFIQERYDEKEKAFKAAQQQLARYSDYNRFMQTALAKTSIERLQSEYDIAFSVYGELAKQLETQKIQVKEDTPVFTVLKPVSVPMEKSKPKRPLILIIWTFLGGILGVASVFGKVYFDELKVKWKEQ
jgi:uncharacterized protein involved in exopolysaccharide biosynthesis